MYRDDPLDDEFELREIIGDDATDALLEAGGPELVGVAVDLLRVLQGWVDDDAAGTWFRTAQRRLEDRSPVQALVDGDAEEVEDSARRWAAAQG